MAKLIVKATDSHHEFGFKRGDVVAILEDNEDEGAMVRNGQVMPDGKGTIKYLFRLLTVPGPAADLQYLLTKGDPVVRAEKVYRCPRKERLNLTALETIATSKLGKTPEITEVLPMTKIDLDNHKTFVVMESDIIL